MLIKKQHGFAFILIVAVIAVLVTLWVASKNLNLISYFKSYQLESELSELKLVKERLLQFAFLQPEIYLTDDSGAPYDESQLPAPGYFPCPDLDGDGLLTPGNETNCYNTGNSFLPDPINHGLGYVPREIVSRNYYFAEEAQFYYFLDERFSHSNGNFTNEGALRFAPLHPDQLDPDKGGVKPVLTLNGKEGYVAIIIDPGSDGVLNGENSNGNGEFANNPGNISMSQADTLDKIVGISYDEWLAWMGRRVCAELGRYSGDDADFSLISTTEHWVNDYDATDNPRGSNWEDWKSECPPQNYP